MRALAQLISYELPLLLAIVPVVLVAGSLSTTAIVEQQGVWRLGFLPQWHIFTPWGFAGFLIFFAAALAEFGLPGVDRAFVVLTVGKGSEHLVRSTLEHVGAAADLYETAMARVLPAASNTTKGRGTL